MATGRLCLLPLVELEKRGVIEGLMKHLPTKQVRPCCVCVLPHSGKDLLWDMYSSISPHSFVPCQSWGRLCG